MDTQLERNLGKQPIARIMENLELIPHDLVAASREQINHKMVKRACKGRRLTSNVKTKIRNAINNKTGQEFLTGDLFNY